MIKKIDSRAIVNVNEQLAKELHKPVIKKFEKKVYAKLKDNIWAADLAEMKSFSSKNKNVEYLLCVIDIFTKYARVKPLKDKNEKQLIMILSKYWMNLILNQIKYGLIKEENSTQETYTRNKNY